MDEIAGKWLEKALSDISHAKSSLGLKDYGWAQFASQQAAEKAMKSACISKGEGALRTHDIALLARKIGAPKEIMEKCGLLNSFYTFSRYPEAGVELDAAAMKSAAVDAVRAAEEVIGWCRKQIQT